MEYKELHFLYQRARLLPGYMVFCIVFFIACDDSGKISGIHSQYAKLKTLQPIDSLVLNLDYESVPYLAGIEILTFDQNTYLFTLINKLNLIKQYELKDGKLISTIDLNLEEHNKIGELIGYQHISRDTLLCHDRTGNLWIIPLNSLDEELLKINMNKIEPYNKLFFDPTQLKVIRLGKYKFLFANYMAVNFDDKILAIVEFDKRNVSLHVEVPREHVAGYFAYKKYAFWNYIYDEEKQLFYFSFPNLDSLYVYNIDFDFQEKLEFKSKLKKIKDEPLFPEYVSSTSTPKVIDANWPAVEDHIKTQFFYESILFNEQKNEWYRFTGLPIQYYKIKLRDPVESEVRHYTLIVANSDFEYVEEYSIPYNKYMMEYRSYFIHDGKLYIERKMDTEDKIIIDIFDI